MQFLLLALLLAWAFFGHTVLCVALINRAHATPIKTRIGKLVWLSMGLIVPGVPVCFAYWFWVRAEHLQIAVSFAVIPVGALPYLVTCWLAALVATSHWIQRHAGSSVPDSLRSDRRRVFQLLQNPSRESGAEKRHLLVNLPGNQILDLDVVERGLEVRGLPAALDGLSVLHLSDLHFTGMVPKAYFQEVVQICNDLEPDLVALTGDLVDNSVYIDWIPDTLGRLESRYGRYFVLGNHDLETDVPALRRRMHEAGFVDLEGRWIEVRAGNSKIVLAGNLLPWSAPAADFSHAPPPSSRGGPVRIALSHSPDQLPWSQRNEVDLLLAGHLHGGQIRIPLVGPIVSPSWHGVRYASGVFQAPPTIMHVSRGISGEVPVRLNCRPEVTKLILHATQTGKAN